MATVRELGATIGMARACSALGMPRSSFYRRCPARPRPQAAPRPRPRPKRALAEREKANVLQVLNSEPGMDLPMRQVYAARLDRGILCSVRTMYRILEGTGEVRERRDQLFGRSVVAYMVATRESGELCVVEVHGCRRKQPDAVVVMHLVADGTRVLDRAELTQGNNIEAVGYHEMKRWPERRAVATCGAVRRDEPGSAGAPGSPTIPAPSRELTNVRNRGRIRSR